MSDDGEFERMISAKPWSTEGQKAFAALYHAADAVKLHLTDDPNEYSDAEKLRALDRLYDAMDAAASQVGVRK